MHNGYELERCFDFDDLKVKVTKWGILKLRFFLKYNFNFFVFEDKLFFEPRIFKINRFYLNGYWQSEKYFCQIQEEIKQIFKILIPKKQILKEIGII